MRSDQQLNRFSKQSKFSGVASWLGWLPCRNLTRHHANSCRHSFIGWGWVRC